MTFVPVVRPFNPITDILPMARIDRESFIDQWSLSEFTTRLTGYGAKYQAVVSQLGSGLVGFAVYRLMSREVVLNRVAVAPASRRRGVGETMLAAIAEITRTRRQRVSVLLPETDLDSQLFMQKCGFLWTATLSGKFSGSERDTYRMVREIGVNRRVPSTELVGSVS